MPHSVQEQVSGVRQGRQGQLLRRGLSHHLVSAPWQSSKYTSLSPFALVGTEARGVGMSEGSERGSA